MAEITKLLEILLEGNAREDLDRKLCSDSIAPGLLHFDAILRRGTADAGDGRLWLESWNGAQIDAVVAIARVIVKACVSATVETVGAAVLDVLEGAIEFCVCGLERWKFDGEDLHLQNDMVKLLEMALVDDTSVEPSSDSEDHSLLDCVGSLPDVSNEVEHVELRSRKRDPQGVITLKDMKPTDRVVITTASADPISCPTSQFPDSTISLSKHIGVLHVKCLPRLLWVSKKFLQLLTSLTDASKISAFTRRSSFILRILKLLGNVSKDVPVQLDTDLLTAVTCYADDLLALFQHEFEFIFREAAVITETFECHLLLLLEELMHLVQVVFSNGNIFQNVQTCVVAKMLGIFDVQFWRYNRSSSTLKPPSIYCPKVIIYLVKLMRDIKMQTTQTLDWKGNFEIDPCSYLSGSETNPPSWAVGSKRVFLLKKYLPEEHLRLLFPPSKEWVDDFINLVFFLHSEGVKLKSKVEKMYSSHANSVAVLDLDSTTSHEDEALFGNLFSESNRSCGSNDSRQDQPEVGSTTASNICHMFINATAELLSFMKLCIFCPEWSASVYEDACKKVTENHISTLISILSCQSVLVDEKKCESNTTLSEKTSRNISDICFGLLHNLLVWRSLSPTNEQHLVDEILKVENGKYVYNSYTLTLLAHVLFSRSDLTGSQLTMKIYKSFVDFIVRKCKDNQCYSDFKELLDSLPCTFHMEILLMAFHLSSESEKASLASYVFLSLESLDAPVVDLNAHKLTCWGLLVSRLILLVQHFLTYPSTSPVWLLLRLRAILKEAPPVDSLMDPSGDHLGSWTSNVLVILMADGVKELPIARGLLSQLVDFSLLSSTAHKDDIANQILGLNSMELLAIFLRILGYWEGRIAEVVEDLVVERYIFMLCWDTASVFSCDVSDSFMPQFDFQKFDSMSTNVFFLFGRCLRSNSMITHDSNPSAMIPKFLEQLSSARMLEQGQDVLKNGAWLSLLLSLLQSGIWLYSVKSDANEAWPYWVEHSSRKNQFLFVAGNTLETIFKGSNRIGWLVSALLCCLRMSMQRFQEAFLDDFGDRQCHGCDFSPYLLLKHTMFDRSKHDELLGKSTADYSRLESIFGLLSKLNDITKAGNAANAVPSILRSSLHGFPLNQEISSAILLSCILTIHDIICTLDGLFKLQNVREDTNIEKESIVLLLDLVMTVQSDRVFQVVHGKCADIFCSLVAPSKEKLDYGYLFQLKHIETFLAHLNSKGTTDHTIQEMLVSSIIDAIEALKKDPSKVEIFKFYLGAEGSREQDELFGSQHGNLLILIDALDICHSEAINVKVFNLFVDLLDNFPCPGLREKVLERFLSMNLPAFSVWLEFRLLGSTTESSNDVHTTKGSPLSLRESTMNFIMSLLSHPGETRSQEFHCHLVEGMLNILDKAFICYDINIAKAYFNFVLQLLNGRPMLKQLLQRVVLLLQNLAGNETSLHALEFLAGFLCNAMGDHGTRNTSDELREKLSAGCTVESIVPRQVNSRKNTETLVLAAGEEATSTSIDCDATSVDDDEDDGTSDGEVASIDKDEEESNGDKALASRVCTFTSSGSNFMEQHWYFCYTCDLTVSKGCCSVCAKVCHRGHRVVYSRSSRFFCDCGAGGVRGSSCQCLKPRKFSSSSNSVPVHSSSGLQVLMPFSEDGDQIVDSDSDLDDIFAETDSAFQLYFPKEVQNELPVLFEDLHIEDKVLQVCDKLLPRVISRRDSNISAEKKVILRGDKVLSFNVDIFRLKKAYKSGSLDLKIRAEYPNSRELKCHLSGGSLTKSLLSVSTRGRLAAGEGDKVSIFDVGQLIGQSTIAPVTADKSNIKPLSKNMVRFEIVHLMFNPLVENYLVVAGYEECQVLTINPRGEVTDRLAIELALQGAYIRRVDWVPGSQVQLLVVTNMFVKIYDLSQDNISPMHYFTLADDLIVDATLVTAPMGRVFLLVFSELGNLFRLEVLLKGDVGAKLLKDIVQIPKKDVHAKGQSLYFSPSHRLLFLSYQDGMTCIGRLDADASSITEMSTLYDNDQDAKPRLAALHHWKDLLVDSGVFTCLSSIKQNAALAVSLDTHELFAQNMRYVGGSSLALVGVAAYKPLSKDKAHCLVLHEDGSFQIYSYTPSGAEATSNVNSNQPKKIGVGILSNKAYAEMKPEFPLDFFERTICITADVGLSSEAIKNSDSEGIKQRLASEDGFIESSSPAGFKVTVFNSNPDIVMVGIRLQVGNTSASHIPSEVAIFQRVIKLDEGMRSWYDIPFTTAESLLADEEFTISIGPTFNGSTSPRIDSLEVYGRAKDEFGWKEKMDAILDMEADVLLSNSVPVGLKKKHRIAKVSSLEEQVLAHMLKLLSRFYSLCKQQSYSEAEEATAELIKLKCSKTLETIFQSDREPLLRFAACHVLQSLFPKREIYYHVKDKMCLFGVLKSAPLLSSRVGCGNGATGWVVKEFIAKTRAVSKIALVRRTNVASFLEAEGSVLVDGLMQVFWEIMNVEQPDTQTINNIVVPCVELIYSYAECLALRGPHTCGHSVEPAVKLFKELLFAPYESVQTSSSLAISSRLLQVPFPKQRMLGTDENSENQASTHVRTDVTGTTGRNVQSVIEEDSTTSSVQYCCDGCSTVPILRRRWHCNVCPDFDLCEACYEVMDADRLPPPHSKDHRMSAIPIDIDSLGGDGNEIQFSMDELNRVNLGHISSNIRSQTSPSPGHVLESNDAVEDSTATDQRIVSISASKRAVNSLLLRQLITDLNGWMENTSGVRAIPLMQLFYRLSSAVGGPFMDSSKPEALDLERFVKWFLDEINLKKPFATQSRTFFGETSILVFMFFTLMLRNWHHPGSESSHSKSAPGVDVQDKGFVSIPPSFSLAASSSNSSDKDEFASQLVRACSCLRHQVLVNYLMDILLQLVPHFKYPPMNSESGLPSNSGCGSLLTVRRELPAGNFSPFFSDSYAKAHRSDLFMDYHKLLLENTFRLVYSLIRPEKQDKSVEKDKICKNSAGKDLKLDGYQDVLCNYISNPNTIFVRRYARRLFLHLCGSKHNYYSVRDSWQLANEVKKLRKLVSKSGGFCSPVPYERSVKLVKCLSTMAEIAGARPRNWQKYCSKHVDVLSFLMEGIFYFGEESVVQTLKLLNLAFYPGKDMMFSILKPDTCDTAANSSGKSGSQPVDSKKKKKGEDGSESSGEKCLDMEQAVEVFSLKNGTVLKHFVDTFLLEWNSSSVRMEAKSVLYGAWHHGKQSFKEALLTALLQKIKFLPMYGQNIVEYTELLTLFIGKASEGRKQQEIDLINHCLTSDVIKCIFETFHNQNELLANHPNSRIYNTLSSLVEFDGYFLESEPCVACSCPEVPYSRMKLEALKFETKFTDNRIIVKCTGSYTIQSVIMNVHDARKSKSVKVLNLYYNNRPVVDLSELKNNWSLWKRAKNCHLTFNQTELKVDFPIPITACNFMIELDSFYENLQASSLESLQCPRCSRSVTDKHGICSNCHENAYQCRQCRNINYENLDSFLCNECGYSKYGRFEFNFMARPSFLFDLMENDEDMKKGLAAIEAESENAHRRYQQLMGFKKPLLKLVSSIGEHEIDSQQKDTVQQMMVSLPGPSCKINRKIALLGVLYGEKCKAAFDSVSKSVQTLQGLRRVLTNYLQQSRSGEATSSRFATPRLSNNCYGCATTFVSQCMELLQVLSKHPSCKKQLISDGILVELFENNIHQGPKAARIQARVVLCAFSEGDSNALAKLNSLIHKKVMYCLEHHRSMDIAQATREELCLLSEACAVVDEFWEARLRVAFQLLFASIKLGAKNPSISEHIILPCLRIISQACTPPKSEPLEKDQGAGKPVSALSSKNYDFSNSPLSSTGPVDGGKSFSDSKNMDVGQKGQEIPLLSYAEWEKGASYIDFVRRQYKISQAVKSVSQRSHQGAHRNDYLALKYGLRWKRICLKRTVKNDFSTFELGSWVSELILSACSQSIRAEVCSLVSLLCPQNSFRRFQLMNLLMLLLPATLSAGENAAEYFELFFKMIDSETALLFLTAKGCLATVCRLITQEVGHIESQERSLNIDISQGFILHKLVELLSKFLEVPNIRSRFMREDLLSDVLESLLIIRGLIVQKTKLISDCNKLLKDLLDSLLVESTENKKQFIRACISGLQMHGKEKKGRTCLFILEQLCNLICPSKPEPVYLLILNKAHTQEEFIRGSMTKNPYSSTEIGPLMRDVKNKICHQLDLLGLVDDDYGMELLVAGNIISLDLSISQVYEQVWKKSQRQMQSTLGGAAVLTSGGSATARDCPPMTITYRLQGLDGEATEPMIKELEEEREESQDPEVEFAIAGSVQEFGGLEVILSMIQRLRDYELKSNQEELASVLNLLMYCCKIRENRRVLLRFGALGLLLETARRAFSVDAMEPAEGILLIVESLTMEANESDSGVNQSVLTVGNEKAGAGEQAKKIVLMFLERLCYTPGLKKSNKQQRNNEMVARILPYLTYGEPAAMEALIEHFVPYLHDWVAYDHLQKKHQENVKDEAISQEAGKQRSEVENFVRVSKSLDTSSCGEKLKDIILEKGITAVAVRHLRESFTFDGQVGSKTSMEWQNHLTLPSVPVILSMLRGLSRAHFATQKYIEEDGVLPLLHALEGVSGENGIGARAENLLDTLSDKDNNGDGFLLEKVNALRHATRNEMRKRALKKREELLQGLGMRQELASDGGERIIVAQPVIEGLEDVEEEKDGLACMVCREGYTLRPNDILGVYSFSKRVNLGAGSSGSSRGECVYTTVSHFNIIHFQCHQEAKRADAALKNPKKEWEGATLRNNETLCNCIFPLKGPSVPLSQYVRYVDQYWENLNALGRVDGSRLRLLTYDIVLMLARFATGASFSTDSKGGGKESNARFLPFMIQMACHLLDQGNSSQPRRSMARSISSYLSASSVALDSPSRSPSGLSIGRSSSGSSDDTVQFMMVNSLLSESYDEWSRHLLAFLQRSIFHAYMQHTRGRSTLRFSSDPGASVVKSSDSQPSDDSKLFSIIQPMLIYTGLIEQLQRFFKYSSKSSKAAGTKVSEADKAASSSSGLESWEILTRERLVNMKEMVGFSKELLSWLEDMTTAVDLQEAFDTMGALGAVLSGGFSRCEDFVQAAIDSGKA